MTSLGQRIKDLRIRDGITQRELGEFMGYKTTRSIQSIEAGNQSLDHHGLIKLADYFDVSLDYLVGRSDDPTRR
jgi:transcriptional regulator with XRE-family HTH domain